MWLPTNPIGSMGGFVYIPTFTIKINQKYANLPYMDPMGILLKPRHHAEISFCPAIFFFPRPPFIMRSGQNVCIFYTS